MRSSCSERWDVWGFRRSGSAEKRHAELAARHPKAAQEQVLIAQGVEPVPVRVNSHGGGLRQTPTGEWVPIPVHPERELPFSVGPPTDSRTPLATRGGAYVVLCQSCGDELAVKRQRVYEVLNAVTVPLVRSRFASGDRRLFLRDGDLYAGPRDDLPAIPVRQPRAERPLASETAVSCPRRAPTTRV